MLDDAPAPKRRRAAQGALPVWLLSFTCYTSIQQKIHQSLQCFTRPRRANDLDKEPWSNADLHHRSAQQQQSLGFWYLHMPARRLYSPSTALHVQVKSSRKGKAAAKPAKDGATAAAGGAAKGSYVADLDSDGGQPAQPARGRIAARRRLGMASGMFTGII